MGFGRENIDCPDLRPERSANNLRHRSRSRQGYSLSHDRRQPHKLEHVTCDEQQRVEQLLFFACGTAPGEEDNENGYRTYHCDDEVHYIERRLPKLLQPSRKAHKSR